METMMIDHMPYIGIGIAIVIVSLDRAISIVKTLTNGKPKFDANDLIDAIKDNTRAIRESTERLKK